ESIVDLVGRNNLHFCTQTVGCTKVKHFLCLWDAAHFGAGKVASETGQRPGPLAQRLGGQPHENQGAVQGQKGKVLVDVDIRRDRVDDQVETPLQDVEGGWIRGCIVGASP